MVSLTKPTVGASEDTWGTTLNTALDDIVGYLDGTTPITPDLTSFDIGSVAVTSTAEELNKLDGFTGVVADLNIIAGGDAAGVSATEFQYLNGVTSDIQTQIDTKAPTASPTFTGTPAAPTASTGTDTTQIATTAFVQNHGITQTSGNPGYFGLRAFALITGTTVTEGQNIASVASGGTGIYNVTFTTAMPDANYAVTVTANRGTQDAFCNVTSRTTTTFQVRIQDQNANLLNPTDFSVMVAR